MAPTGISNILAAANSVMVGFVQWEPGTVFTQFMDVDFVTNQDRCLRYYQKSYPYGVAPGTASSAAGQIQFLMQANTNAQFFTPFKKVMARTPTVTGYSPTTGASGNLRDASANTDKAITATSNPGDAGFSGFTVGTPNAALWCAHFHYTAGTGY